MKLGPTWVSCYYPPAGVKALKVHTHIYTHIHTNFSIMNTKNSLSYWLKIVKLTSTFFFNSFTICHICVHIIMICWSTHVIESEWKRKSTLGAPMNFALKCSQNYLMNHLSYSSVPHAANFNPLKLLGKDKW